MSLKQRNNSIIVIDIGSSKIACLVAKINASDEIVINGLGYHSAQGIKSGIITDINTAENSILKAIEMAEENSGERIKKAYVSISSAQLISHQIRARHNIVGHEVGAKDLSKILLNAMENHNSQNLESLHTFVYNYSIDGNSGIRNPLGMYGTELQCDVNIVSTPTNNLLNFTNCLDKCGIQVLGYIASGYASGISSLQGDEMEIGVNVIDFGAGSTSFTIFQNSHMVYTDAVTVGGMNITNDIAISLGIETVEAERLKNLYGGVIVTDSDIQETIEVQSNFESELGETIINRALLIEIIRARVDEILDLLMQKILHSNIRPASRFLITGGGARLSGLRELIAHVFSSKARIGQPSYVQNIDNSIQLELGVASGMLKHIAENIDSKNKPFKGEKNRSSITDKILKWLNQYLQG